MKKIVIFVTLALVLAFAAPVFANPFTDVPADHWAYDAISKLAADGIINGNTDGTFTGNKAMTRYQMATIVAKAMAASEANADKVSAEDQAALDKLATEFSAELNTLGVRVTALENKVGNVKFTGDARVRYTDNEVGSTSTQARVRLTATGMVNDNFTVQGRLTTGDYNLNTSANSATNVAFDRLLVKYDGKIADIVAGRQGATLGKATLLDDKNLDGVTLTAPIGKYTVTAMSGRVFDADEAKTELNAVQFDGVKLFDKVSLGAAYAKTDVKVGTDNYDAVSVYGDYALNNKIGFFGEFVKSNADDNNKAYYVGTSVKNIVNKTDLAVSYAQVEKDALVDGFNGKYTTHDLYNATGADKNEVVKVSLNHSLAKNTNLYADYTSMKAKGASVEDTATKVETGVQFKF